MNLSESYKKRLQDLSGVLEESKSKTKYEYQIRDIGGDTFYKRAEGEKIWIFTNEVDYCKNANSKNIVNWEKPKEKNVPKVKEIEIDQKLNYKKHPLETYKRYLENVCPSNFKIEIKDGYIKIKKSE